ncbi:hypothetical protein L1D04_20390 [Klebsiella pneumoniae]|uniref:pPIWI-associating nuclease domain-containing protein n=1 Tax=Klebsiella pneumoniae TaxID=573 RepID=UPI0020CDAED2|nr:hypothetical protein [Klebsiella pneumoniae]MCQ0940293.1 hypothetical protein [Klebsiella pneumoniae]
MKLKRMLQMNFIKEFQENLDNDFEEQLFIACLRNYCSHGNPLRFSNFAYALRELINHVLSRMAPDERVITAPWFTANKNNVKVTRKQQAKYIAQKHIPDGLLDAAALKKLDDGIGWFNKNYQSLNYYTHITEESLKSQPKDFFEKAKLLIELCNKIFDNFGDLERILTHSIIDKVSDHVNEVTRDNTPNEVDILSSQTIVETCIVESIEPLSLTEDYVYLLVRGTLEITRQYGRGDDYLAQGDYYPFTFTVSVRASDFEDIRPLVRTAIVDTGSWYDDGNGSAMADKIYSTRRFLEMIALVHIKPARLRSLFPELSYVIPDDEPDEMVQGLNYTEIEF